MLRTQCWKIASFQRSFVSQPSSHSLLICPHSINIYSRHKFSTTKYSLIHKQTPTLSRQNPSKPPSKLMRLASPTPRKPTAYQSLNEQLATKFEPTLLYRASSYTHYITACYTAGIFFVGVAFYNYNSPNYVELDALPGYIPVFITIGSFMIACIGFWMFLKVLSFNP